MIFFDFETEPLPDAELQKLMPAFDSFQFQPTEFDPAIVKCGNMGAEKARDKINQKREEHQKEQSDLSSRLIEGAEKHWEDFKSQAALSPVTGCILVCGYYAAGTRKTFLDDGDGSESKLLQTFWFKFDQCQKSGRRMAGLNILQFDLPFAVRRSWLLEIDIPSSVFGFWKHRLNWSDTFVDLRNVWLLGQPWTSCKSNFGTLAGAFDTGGKPTGVDGSQFSELWRNDRKAAEEYLLGDLVQPALWAEKMGIF